MEQEPQKLHPSNLMNTLGWEKLVEKILFETEEVDNKKFKAWLLSKEYLGGNLFDSFTYLKCFNIYNKINHEDKDHFEVLIGKPSSGKSTLAMKEAILIDPSFNPERIFTEYDKFIEWLHKKIKECVETGTVVTKGQAIQLDEGINFLFNMESGRKDNVSFVKVLEQIRQLNIVIFFCIPDYKNLHRYIKTFRSDGMVLIYKGLRQFKYFNDDACRYAAEIVEKGVDIMAVRVKKGTFYEGEWNNHIPSINGLDFYHYKQQKMKNFLENVEKIKAVEKPQEGSEYITIKEAQKILPLSFESYYKLIEQGKIEGLRHNRRHFIKKSSLFTPHGVVSESIGRLQLPSTLPNGGATHE